MSIGSSYHLFSEGKNVAKLRHMREELKIESIALYLAPADTVPGLNLCPASTDGCRNGCLFNSGMAEIWATINQQRIERTIFWRDQRDAFMYLINQDLERLVRSAEKHGTWPAARMNATSDIKWTDIQIRRNGRWYDDVFEAYPEIQFYDYSKLPHWVRTRPTEGVLPANYHITFSLSESNDKTALKALANGFNVAVPMHIKKGHAPTTFSGFPVIDGDKHDFRFLDPKEGGHIVALSPKGKFALNDHTSGFIKDPTYQIQGA